ncbi:MAG TPA: PilZ domain-containing protein [Erythrobacter sp.]|nr:PilZ domain-containing protein [Erythrobacter sp.]
MTGQQRRSLERHDVVQLADVQIGRDPAQHRIKVRNVSARGLMGEGALHVSSGTRLTIDLPEVGPVAGTVVWVQEPRFGVAFDDEVELLA